MAGIAAIIDTTHGKQDKNTLRGTGQTWSIILLPLLLWLTAQISVRLHRFFVSSNFCLYFLSMLRLSICDTFHNCLSSRPFKDRTWTQSGATSGCYSWDTCTSAQSADCKRFVWSCFGCASAVGVCLSGMVWACPTIDCCPPSHPTSKLVRETLACCCGRVRLLFYFRVHLGDNDFPTTR